MVVICRPQQLKFTLNVDMMLDHRLRRWPTINPTLFVFSYPYTWQGIKINVIRSDVIKEATFVHKICAQKWTPDQSNHLIASIAAALNLSGNAIIGGGGVPPQHRWSAQRWADDINLWPNAVLAFNHTLGQYLYVWVITGFL